MTDRKQKLSGGGPSTRSGSLKSAMHAEGTPSDGISRRQFMQLTAATGVTLCSSGCWSLRLDESRAVVKVPLQVAPVAVDLAGTLVNTFGYNRTVPGPEIRIKEGQTLLAPVHNAISEPTLVHWHGISLINSMDGTKLVQSPIQPGSNFNYEFVVPEAGSHWYHSHFGVQADRGLYGPLIVEPHTEALAYDREYTLILDDWSDGLDMTPAPVTGRSRRRSRVQFSPLQNTVKTPIERISFGGRAYPLMLVNARPPADPAVFKVRKGERVRLRVINAAADTGFRFAIAGHRMTVTHSDGMPVESVVVDALRIGMAERYDVIIDANAPGAWQIGVLPEGKRGFGRAVLRYVDALVSATPPAEARPIELDRRLLIYDDLVGTAMPKVERGSKPDRIYNMTLHHTSIHVDGLAKDEPIMVSTGDIVRFNIRNETANWHPMHLHGHHFHLGNAGRALKDTVNIPARGGVSTWDWCADNPGKWMMHCHNLYHMKDGMMRVILYE